MTPLLYAMKGSHAETAKYLVEHGANPNNVYVDDKQKSHNLLMDSVVVNNTDFALQLLDMGADVNYADDDGVTVLTQASYTGQTAIVEALLAKEADTSLTNKEGINPLIASCSEGHVEIVKMLLQAGRKSSTARTRTVPTPSWQPVCVDTKRWLAY